MGGMRTIWREGCYVCNVNKVDQYNRLYGIMTVPQDLHTKATIRTGGFLVVFADLLPYRFVFCVMSFDS